MAKKVLILGATGAMGQYLVPLLARQGYQIDAVSFDDVAAPLPANVRHIKANVKENDTLLKLLQNHYDGIVDFLIYLTAELVYRLPMLVKNTGHYIYLSSYRIYDNKEHPVKESSPRLLDSSEDVLLRNSDDYCIYKARGENILQSFAEKNWTIIRPAITYSLMRYQLVTLEAANTVGRAFAGKAVVLPEQARTVQATMSWAGDVAQMIAGLLFNEKARGETFTVATAEHHSWGEIADYYKDICNLKAVWVDKKDYLRILCPDPYQINASWQLEYDRLFDRIMDNSKVLQATGMTQAALTKLYDGLTREIARCPKDHPWPVHERMDAYLENLKMNH
ncbi:MAG: NAD-dependent epimerase/dehydratase family protein [Lentisphaeria bacterium]|nr:NAD-dependent epimerase/dehydratase family protein [Lentisphaeria bacterium]